MPHQKALFYEFTAEAIGISHQKEPDVLQKIDDDFSVFLESRENNMVLDRTNWWADHQFVVRVTDREYAIAALEWLKQKYGERFIFGEIKEAIKRTVYSTVFTEERYLRSTGTRYAHVKLNLLRGVRGSGVIFENTVSKEAISLEYIHAIREGAMEFTRNYCITDCVIRLVGGSQHPTDSTYVTFQIACFIALIKLWKKKVFLPIS